jgi:hypothetical protein
MFKKIALVAAALAIAAPVFAGGEPPKDEHQQSGITISNEDAFVLNEISAVGISGKNDFVSEPPKFSFFGGMFGNKKSDVHLTTGAVTVGADVSTALNQFQSSVCGECSRMSLTIKNDDLKVINKVSAIGISGKNNVGSGHVTTGTVYVYPLVSTVGNITVLGDVEKP